MPRRKSKKLGVRGVEGVRDYTLLIQRLRNGHRSDPYRDRLMREAAETLQKLITECNDLYDKVHFATRGDA